MARQRTKDGKGRTPDHETTTQHPGPTIVSNCLHGGEQVLMAIRQSRDEEPRRQGRDEDNNRDHDEKHGTTGTGQQGQDKDDDEDCDDKHGTTTTRERGRRGKPPPPPLHPQPPLRATARGVEKGSNGRGQELFTLPHVFLKESWRNPQDSYHSWRIPGGILQE